jgi:uncharacterized spore protein YtfJ
MIKFLILSRGLDFMVLSEVINTALERLQYIAKTETIFGEPIAAGDMTLIPVSKVSIGFAAGGAGKDEKSASGTGTGGGVNVTPVALIVISGKDIKVHSLTGNDLDLGKILSMAPEAIKKLSKFFKKKDEDEPAETSD